MKLRFLLMMVPKVFSEFDLGTGKIMLFKSSPRRSGVLRKRCSENMQKIYKRTPMPNCNFNQVAKRLYLNHTLAWVFPVNLLHIFRTPFPKNTSGWLLLFMLTLDTKMTRLLDSFQTIFVGLLFPFYWIVFRDNLIIISSIECIIVYVACNICCN